MAESNPSRKGLKQNGVPAAGTRSAGGEILQQRDLRASKRMQRKLCSGTEDAEKHGFFSRCGRWPQRPVLDLCTEFEMLEEGEEFFHWTTKDTDPQMCMAN